MIGFWMIIGGAAGFVLSAAGLIVSRLLLARRWKKLRETFDQEYGHQEFKK